MPEPTPAEIEAEALWLEAQYRLQAAQEAQKRALESMGWRFQEVK